MRLFYQRDVMLGLVQIQHAAKGRKLSSSLRLCQVAVSVALSVGVIDRCHEITITRMLLYPLLQPRIGLPCRDVYESHIVFREKVTRYL